jgi:hypothetical protein
MRGSIPPLPQYASVVWCLVKGQEQLLPLLYMGPYHHDLACRRVADVGDGLQVWKVATNVLNKQSWTADRGWISGLGLGG